MIEKTSGCRQNSFLLLGCRCIVYMLWLLNFTFTLAKMLKVLML